MPNEPYVRVTLSDIYREVKEIREEARQDRERAASELAEIQRKFVSKRAAYLAVGLLGVAIGALSGIVAIGDRLWA